MLSPAKIMGAVVNGVYFWVTPLLPRQPNKNGCPDDLLSLNKGIRHRKLTEKCNKFQFHLISTSNWPFSKQKYNSNKLFHHTNGQIESTISSFICRFFSRLFVPEKRWKLQIKWELIPHLLTKIWLNPSPSYFFCTLLTTKHNFTIDNRLQTLLVNLSENHWCSL